MAPLLPNVVLHSNQRTTEIIPLGAVKISATGVIETPGAATEEPEGVVSGSQVAVQVVDQAGVITTKDGVNEPFSPFGVIGYPITGVTAFTDIYIGSKVSDAGQKKYFPVASNVEVVGINEGTSTIYVNVAPATAVINPEGVEQAKATRTEKILFTNYTELPILTEANAKKAGVLPTGALLLTSGAFQFAANVNISLNILEGTATAESLVPILLTSFDGGLSWVEYGKGASLAVTEKGAGSCTFSVKEKLAGQRFAVSITTSVAANKASGYVAVTCDRTTSLIQRTV